MRERFLGGNPFSALTLKGGDTLLDFYCRWPEAPFRNSLFYLADGDAVAVAEYRGDTLELREVLGGEGSLPGLAESLARPETRRAVLGFAPADAGPWSREVLWEEDTTLFVWSGGKAPFDGEKLRFPALSHA